jgi:hypothetical protein
MRRICENVRAWGTTDSLSLGGLLTEAAQLTHLIASGDIEFDDLLPRLLSDARHSLEAYASGGELVLPVAARLAFRELGLSIGLRCLDPMRVAIKQHAERLAGMRSATTLLDGVESMARFAPMAERIESLWLTEEAQSSTAWEAHLDINSAMLATSLVPDMFIPADGLGQVSKQVGARPAVHP